MNEHTCHANWCPGWDIGLDFAVTGFEVKGGKGGHALQSCCGTV